MAGEESFELSIEVLQAIELKRFRVKAILLSGAFSEVSVTDSAIREFMDSYIGHWWASRERSEVGVALVSEVLDPDFAGEESVCGELA